MADDIDFFDLPTTNTKVIMGAGALAGILEHTVMFPIDSVKTRIQLLKSSNPNSSIYNSMKSMIKNEGFFSPYRGIGAVLIGTGPAHALYFSTYEFSKINLPKLSPIFNDSKLQYGISGICATVIHDFCLNPIEVVKQRLQMDNQKYKGILHCIKCVSKTEGLSAFYRSYNTQLMMNVPYNLINFITYESVRKFLYSKLHKNFTNKSNNLPFDPKIHLIAGSCSGCLASALTVPFDVLKTQLNTQRISIDKPFINNCHCNSHLQIQKAQIKTIVSSDCNSLSLGSTLMSMTNPRNFSSHESVPLKGIFDATHYIYSNAGIKGFFRGTLARVIYNTPACAICWSVYEFFKTML